MKLKLTIGQAKELLQRHLKVDEVEIVEGGLNPLIEYLRNHARLEEDNRLQKECEFFTVNSNQGIIPEKYRLPFTR